MERKLIQIEKAWEQAVGNIFQPYAKAGQAPTSKAVDNFGITLASGNHDIRRHMARTAKRQGLMSLNQYLADDDWTRRSS